MQRRLAAGCGGLDMMSVRRVAAYVFSGCALLASWAAEALPDDCTVAATTFNFGIYDTVNPLTGTMTLVIECENPTGGAKTFNYTLKLTRGPGTYTARQMTSGASTLVYNLFTSATYTSVWGDGSGGTSSVTGSLTVPGATTLTQTKTVYGLIGGSQNLLPGAYATASPITVSLSGVKSSDKTDIFNVVAAVTGSCTATATNLAFGVVDPLTSQTDSTSTVTVYCTNNLPYTVGLSAGATAGATIAQRRMANGAETMLYNLYTNVARSTIWGDSSGSWVSGTGAGLGTGQALTVYGRVAGGQTNLAAGSYQESTITVTVTY